MRTLLAVPNQTQPNQFQLSLSWVIFFIRKWYNVVAFIVAGLLLYFLHFLSASTCLSSNHNNIDNIVWHRAYKEPREKNSGKTAVVCAVVKDESPYIVEWLDYNIALGFTRIYLYDNSDRFELRQLGEKYREYGIVDVVHKPGWGAKCASYYDCANRAIAENHTWAFFHDIDEFLILKKHGNIVDFANDYVQSGSVGINWRVFGTAGKETYEPIPVLKRFQYRALTNYSQNRFIKSIVRLEHMNLSSPCVDPHYFPLIEGYDQTVTDGTVFQGPMYYKKHGPDDVATIYHYYYKSYEEYIAKRYRGSAFFGNKTIKSSVEAAVNHIGPDGIPIPIGDIYDDTAWVKLKRMIPKYGLYDHLYPTK